MEQIARTQKQLGAAIRRERKRAGLTQAELGARMSLRQATVSSLEAGENATRVQTLLAALAALDLELVVRPRTKGSTRDIEDMF